MAKKKEEFKLPPGTPAPWMSTFSDMMTLLMCFFVLLFSMSEVDAAKFEEIANSFDGVDSTFAIQAGREVRIIVNPTKVDDDQIVLLSRDIAQKIENEMQYPGQIKVNVIRESRAVEIAK